MFGLRFFSIFRVISHLGAVLDRDVVSSGF